VITFLAIIGAGTVVYLTARYLPQLWRRYVTAENVKGAVIWTVMLGVWLAAGIGMYQLNSAAVRLIDNQAILSAVHTVLIFSFLFFPAIVGVPVILLWPTRKPKQTQP
jgi:hypothetical protein